MRSPSPTESSGSTPVPPIDLLSGDFYGACMDEVRVNQLGIGPVRNLLDEISGAQSRADVQRHSLLPEPAAERVPVGMVVSCRRSAKSWP